MDAFEIALVTATVLTSLVAGLLFAFAVVVMPGIATLGDRDFLAAFQAIDGVVQDNQPVFMVVWVGSVVSLVVVGVLALVDPAGSDVVVVALAVNLLGVQAPTVAVNVPLNNALQAVDLPTVDEASCRRARDAFESRWNRWNLARAILAGLTVLLLSIALASG